MFNSHPGSKINQKVNRASRLNDKITKFRQIFQNLNFIPVVKKNFYFRFPQTSKDSSVE